MATRNQPTGLTPAKTAAEEKAEFTFEVGDYAATKSRSTSKVPDMVADLLEELRDAYGKEVKDAKENVIPAGTVKYRIATVHNEEAGDTFSKHVRSYSKTVMYPGWSARLSRLSPTTFRVGVGPVKPKTRRNTAQSAIVEILPELEAGAA